MSDHKDMTHRHLRHKLQSVSRRLDELEETTVKLQKSEDELIDLQVSIERASLIFFFPSYDEPDLKIQFVFS